MKKFEFTGKNVQDAINTGLKELGKEISDVDVKIISNGGLFKKAKVELSFESPELDIENIADSLEREVTKHGGKVFENSYIKVTSQSTVSDGKTVKVTTDNYEKVDDEPAKEEHTEKAIDAKQINNNDAVIDYLVDFLKNLTSLMGEKVDVLVTEDDDKITAKIKNENASKFVGYHGECLNAIQHLTNNVMQRHFGKVKRVCVNVENYREHREDVLKALADKAVLKVMRTGKPYRLDPMNSYERRIVHTYLQDNSNVYTQSTGEEPKRYLVIYPNGYENSKD